MELGISREMRVDARATEKVECEDCLWEKAIPKMWIVWIGAAQAGNEGGL
jgi:hypothetical protein